MHKIAIPALIGLSLTANIAWGICDETTKVTGVKLETLVDGQTVCVSGAANSTWQEEHRSGGELWDYKRGPGHAVDPQKKVGSWAFHRDDTGTAIGVTYLYDGGSSLTYTIHDEGGLYTFCDANGTPVVTGATFQSSSDCGFSPAP